MADEERKVFLREFLAEIKVSPKGEALLMVNPAGLSRLLCLNLVTPRGHNIKGYQLTALFLLGTAHRR